MKLHLKVKHKKKKKKVKNMKNMKNERVEIERRHILRIP